MNLSQKSIFKNRNSFILKYIFISLFLSYTTSAFPETEETTEETTEDRKKNQRKKTGISLGLLPAISYDSDLGFQYGLIANIYHFGDGSRYPQYNHALFFEYSRYTKGNQIARVTYDSDRLLEGIRTTFELAYQHDMLAAFYGYNGYNAVYDNEMIDVNRAFYAFNNKFWRGKLDFQRNFGTSSFGWIAGINIYHFAPGAVDYEKLNSDKTNSIDKLPDDPNLYLYNKYLDWGIISEKETKKNWINYVKLGAKYDTRDHESNPTSGIFTEMIFQTAMESLFNDFPHVRFAFIHRQYVPLVPEKMTFAYRLFYQTKVGNNKIPFYAQPFLISSFETGNASQGLGGGRSLRGVMRNRILGDGFLMGNFEIRWQVFQLTILKQFFDFGVNPFLDMGFITNEVDISDALENMSETDKSTYFKDEKQKLHASGGLGFKIIMNDNFVLSLDFGKSFNKQDGENIRIYTNIGFMF